MHVLGKKKILFVPRFPYYFCTIFGRIPGFESLFFCYPRQHMRETLLYCNFPNLSEHIYIFFPERILNAGPTAADLKKNHNLRQARNVIS